MIPEVALAGEAKLPREARFREPELPEYDDEGIGFFRDVWTIIDVNPLEAREVIEREKTLLRVVDGLATTAQDFDRLARIVERWDPEDPEDTSIDVSPAEGFVLESAMRDSDANRLECLELGVAGLVYALAASRVVTAASCRGHTGDRPWSGWPVVFFATDEAHARVLVPLVQAAGCVFNLDPTRPELLAVAGSSVKATMKLAALLV